MYSPHEAREDAPVPGSPDDRSPNEYDVAGEEIQSKEHQLFGEDGFEVMATASRESRNTLGIYDLSQFTPHT